MSICVFYEMIIGHLRTNCPLVSIYFQKEKYGLKKSLIFNGFLVFRFENQAKITWQKIKFSLFSDFMSNEIINFCRIKFDQKFE